MSDGRPHIFSDIALARRLERAEAHAGSRFVEARARVSPASGAEWIEVAGAYAMFDGDRSPITQTFGLGIFQPVTETALDRLVRTRQPDVVDGSRWQEFSSRASSSRMSPWNVVLLSATVL